jgi:hypothetical protein
LFDELCDIPISATFYAPAQRLSLIAAAVPPADYPPRVCISR